MAKRRITRNFKDVVPWENFKMRTATFLLFYFLPNQKIIRPCIQY